MKRALAVLAIVAAGVMLGACNDKKSNIKPPHELADFAPVVDVQPIWHAKVGRGAGESGVRMHPAAADGRIFAASTDGELVALDATTGRTIWRKQRQWRNNHDAIGYSGGPSVRDDMLAVATRDGDVYLLDAASGDVRWQVAVSAAVISAPVFADDLLLVRSSDGRITAINLADGSQAWLYDRGAVPALSLRGNSGMVVRPGVVFFGSDDGKLMAIRLDNGGPLWEQTVATGEGRTEIQQLSDADGTPLVLDTTVYLGAYQGDLMAVDGPTGRPLWNRPFSTYTALAGSGNTLVGVDDESNVWAFSDGTGGDLWKQDGLSWRWLGAPAVMGDFVVVGDMQGYVHWLDLSDGKFAARVRPSHDAVQARPLVLDDHTVVIEDIHGRLTAYRVGSPAP